MTMTQQTPLHHVFAGYETKLIPIWRRYRSWFYAAAGYNLLWGSLVILRPYALFDLFHIPHPPDIALWQVVGNSIP